MFKKISKCRICSNKKLTKIIDLNNQFLQGSFIKKNTPTPYKKKIPLKLALCQKCSLVQLLHTTDKETLYKNYWYESGINLTMRLHLNNLVKEICTILNIKKENEISVLDIGCNDGTLLNFYPKKFKKYGIDPSQITNKIDKNSINVIRDFFPPKKTKRLKSKFDIITSIAMFYDLDNPNLFVKKIKYHLKKHGIWIFELSYLIDMLKLNSFDTICHEHLEYYSLHSLDYLMKKHKLKIFNISKNSINGGSIRCFVTHIDNPLYDNKKNKDFYESLLSYEKKIRINEKNIYLKFNTKINNLKKQLMRKISQIKKNNKKLFILGASTKGNTILQFMGINDKIIPYAIERNKEKIGAKTIGSNIKIISEKSVINNQPDYKLVLPWHFMSEIVKRETNYIKSGGKLIFPLPKILEVNKKNFKNYA
tara:strand:+ start:585 stop:1850 length:1266 start_codon:yes stop_codon:yes gene_type:complete